ncbi:MAG: sigma-70 family RNA polymerase sigma factor [Bacteroidales bacterium]|nr:sigma-70 family RNA polymerase sigma factor [Bacteroidales bacterium]MBN2698203.1 sigma-70 family RNA polymerase sigma factor [Bacteroidales bacterium]
MEINPNLSVKAQRDFELVELAKKGDQQSYAELMGRYRDAIYFMLLKMVNSTVDAEDLTIEAFGKAFKNIDQYAPSFAFSTWLFKIATNNCIDFIRKKRGSHVSLDQSVDDEDTLNPSAMIQSDSPDPEATMINQQKIKMMRDVVSKLKPRYRNLVELRYFKEYSYEEIADELDLPIGTVKAQLFRARELLLNIINRTGVKM